MRRRRIATEVKEEDIIQWPVVMVVYNYNHRLVKRFRLYLRTSGSRKKEKQKQESRNKKKEYVSKRFILGWETITSEMDDVCRSIRRLVFLFFFLTTSFRFFFLFKFAKFKKMKKKLYLLFSLFWIKEREIPTSAWLRISSSGLME